MSELRGYQVLSGAHGTLHFNNIPVFEVKTVEAKVLIERGDVPVEGGDVDSKMTMRKGEGKFVVQYVYDRGFKELLAAYNKGMDARSTISIANNDPDAVRGQRERTNLANVWFNEIAIASFSRGEVVEREYPFGFTPSDADMAEIIKF